MGIYISLLAIIIILLSIVPLGCKEEIKEPFSVIKIYETNQQSLDRLIIHVSFWDDALQI